jgi:hypothetical protein
MTNDEKLAAMGEQFVRRALAKLSPELLAQFDPETRIHIVAQTVDELLKAELERDPEFRETFVRMIVRQEVEKTAKSLLPIGSYRSDGFIPLDEETFKMMPLATHADLLTWRSLETDPANLAYIDERLSAWPPNCSTLAEVEARLTH